MGEGRFENVSICCLLNLITFTHGELFPPLFCNFKNVSLSSVGIFFSEDLDLEVLSKVAYLFIWFLFFPGCWVVPPMGTSFYINFFISGVGAGQFFLDHAGSSKPIHGENLGFLICCFVLFFIPKDLSIDKFPLNLPETVGRVFLILLSQRYIPFSVPA